ncbi:unnamed protein product [Withania somnifera]
MGKEAAFLSAVHLKKKPMKKRKQLFNKVFDYLKSDTYMFAPDKILEGNYQKKLVSKIGDYLKADTYMYAPLVISQPWEQDLLHLSKGPIPMQEEMDRKRCFDVLKGGTGKADEAGRNTVNMVSKDHDVDGSPRTRSPMVTHTRVEGDRNITKQACEMSIFMCDGGWFSCLATQT